MICVISSVKTLSRHKGGQEEVEPVMPSLDYSGQPLASALTMDGIVIFEGPEKIVKLIDHLPLMGLTCVLFPVYQMVSQVPPGTARIECRARSK